jgi:hypothetical protein
MLVYSLSIIGDEGTHVRRRQKIQIKAQILFFSHGTTAPYWARASSSPRLHGHIQLRHTTLGRTPLDRWSARRTGLHLTKHHTNQRHTFTPPGESRTRSPTKRGTADPRLRPRGRWNRPQIVYERILTLLWHRIIIERQFQMFIIESKYIWLLYHIHGSNIFGNDMYSRFPLWLSLPKDKLV